MSGNKITAKTPTHSIEVVDGYLTIAGEGNTFTPEEMERLLEVLLIWKYGLEAVSVDELDD